MSIPEPSATCPNCAAARTGRFCPQCGQDNRRLRLDLGEWLADTTGAIFSLDSKVVRTMRELTLRPGTLVRDYLAGHRAPYVSPARYVLATCAVWWAAVWFATPDLSTLPISAAAKASIQYGQLLNLGLLPLLSFAPWLAFLGSRLGYAEHLCFLMFTSGHVFLWRAGLAGLGALQPHWGAVLNRVDGVAFLAYLAWAAWFCYRGRVRALAPRIVAMLALLILGSSLAMQVLVKVLTPR